jgi:MFS family permease
VTTGPSSALPRLRPAEWWTLIILLTIYALAYLDRQILTLLVDPIRADLGVSDVAMGFLQGLGFTLFFALCGPFVGWMVDRYNRRVIIFTGIVIWSLSTASSALANSYGQLLLARFGVGAGEAALLPAAYSIISDMVDKSRLGRAMAIFSLGSIVGASLSYAVGGALVDYVGTLDSIALSGIGALRDWQLVFLTIGAVGVPLAFLVFAFPDPGRRRATTTGAVAASASRQHFARHWRFYACHFAAFSLFCFLGAATTAWSATYMMREFGWTPAGVGALLGIKTLVAGALGMIGSGLIADWLIRRGRQDAHLRMYLYILPIHALAGIIAFLTPNMWVAFAALSFVSLISPFIAVAAAGLQLATIPERRGIASATFLLVYNLIGFGLGPPAIALASRLMFGDNANLGPAMALAFGVLPPVIMILLAVGLAPMRKAVADVVNRDNLHRDWTPSASSASRES